MLQGQEYVERYKLEYQREDDDKWFTFRNRRNQEVAMSFRVSIVFSTVFYISDFITFVLIFVSSSAIVR